MSKIAEKQAEELFPFRSIGGGEMEAYFNAGQLHKREIYIKCYDKAMQDFMEKACDYLQKNLWRVIIEDGEFRQRFVTDFKNYMKK